MSYFKRRKNNDYRAIFDECYAELSPEGKREVDEEIAYMVKAFKMARVKGMGETTCGELLACLVSKGLL